MAEATAESPSIVLPNELMIEILFRVDLSNPLQLRCVCKFWNSLILDPQFMKMHVRRSLTEIRDLHNNAKEHYIAFKSQIVGNNPIMPQEQDDLDDDEDEDEDEDDYEDEEAAAEEGDEVEEGKEDEDAEEEDKEKHLLKNIVAPLDVMLVNVVSQLNVLDTINAQLDDILVKTIKANLLAQLDRVKCLKSFLLVYLESPTSSSSQL